jgi:predicted unusual protein kinase regulating ubiquinone biosynthesis (AarF/ABC1/UbiB family)
MAVGGGRYLATLRLAVRFTAQLWWLAKTARLFSHERQIARRRRLYRRQARQFRDFATAMGGLVIKVGQFMSVRIDMLPKEYIDELGQLQDAVPAVPGEQIAAVVEDELGAPLGELFETFDARPIAAASLGQVHRGVLPGGAEVAVKVLRPGIEKLVETDLRSLRSIMSLLARFTHLLDQIDWQAVCQDFEVTHRDELDYIKEGRNAEALQRNLLLNPHVEAPQIHWSHTTARVLTMEFMGGIKIDNLAALDAAGVDRSALARDLMELYLHMLLRDGFFHADPHPSNIFVRPDGVIQLIDFGMVGELPEPMRAGFVRLVGSFFRRDAAAVTTALRDLGFILPGADTSALERALMPVIDTTIDDLVGLFRGTSFVDQVLADAGAGPGRAGGPGGASAPGAGGPGGPGGPGGAGGPGGPGGPGAPGASLDQLRELIRTQPVCLPGQVSFLGKALITVFSNCFKLDPAVDLVDITKRWTASLTGPAALEALDAAWTEAWDLLRSLPATARRLVSLAEKLDTGHLAVSLTPDQFSRLESLHRAQTDRLVRAVAGAAGLLAALALWPRRRR